MRLPQLHAGAKPGRIDRRNPVNWQCPLTRGLVAWWKAVPGGPGCYGGTSWLDLVQGSLGTLNGTATATGFRPTARPGGYGGWSGDGSTGDVTASGVPAVSGNFSVALWFLATSLSNGPMLFSARRPSDFSFDFLVTSTVGQFDIGNGAGWLVTGSQVTHAFSTGVWYSVVAAVTNSSVSMYVNGVLAGTKTFTSGTPLLTNSTHQPALGYNPPGGNRFLAGNIDDARIWNRALSAAEVAALYTDDLQGNPRTLRRPGEAGLFYGASGAVVTQKVPWQLFTSLRAA